MNFLDVRTAVFTGMLTDIICALLIIMLWHNTRKRFPGTGFWAADFVFQTVALVLIILRGSIPDWMSIVLSNTMVIAGAIMGYIGLERFTGKKGPQAHNFVILAVFATVHIYFAFVRPDLTTRTLNLSAGLLIVCFQCALLLLFRVEPKMRPLTRFAGIVFGAYCLVSIARIAEYLVIPQFENDFFKSGLYDAPAMISYQMLFILLTYSLVLMVNKRLFIDIQSQEEKFSKAFHSSPNAIMLTSLSDGNIYEANDGFMKKTGYTSTEVLGKTTFEINLWENAEDRAELVDRLADAGSVQGVELKFRKKSGELFTGLLSADIIMVGNERTILYSISDISRRKEAEEAVQKLLAEKELLLREVHHRIKNNMGIVMSLLALQSDMTDNTSASAILKDARNRLQGMSHLYDALYRSDNFREISLKSFLPPLMDEIISTFSNSSKVSVKTSIEDIIIDARILSPLGIIVNELLTNAMKYAFTGRNAGSLTLTASKHDGRVTIQFEDDGVGIPEGITVDNTAGFGMRLVGMLVKQLKGSIIIERLNGTKYTIEFNT